MKLLLTPFSNKETTDLTDLSLSEYDDESTSILEVRTEEENELLTEVSQLESEEEFPETISVGILSPRGLEDSTKKPKEKPPSPIPHHPDSLHKNKDGVVNNKNQGKPSAMDSPPDSGDDFSADSSDLNPPVDLSEPSYVEDDSHQAPTQETEDQIETSRLEEEIVPDLANPQAEEQEEEEEQEVPEEQEEQEAPPVEDDTDQAPRRRPPLLKKQPSFLMPTESSSKKKRAKPKPKPVPLIRINSKTKLVKKEPPAPRKPKLKTKPPVPRLSLAAAGHIAHFAAKQRRKRTRTRAHAAEQAAAESAPRESPRAPSQKKTSGYTPVPSHPFRRTKTPVAPTHFNNPLQKVAADAQRKQTKSAPPKTNHGYHFRTTPRIDYLATPRYHPKSKPKANDDFDHVTSTMIHKSFSLGPPLSKRGGKIKPRTRFDTENTRQKHIKETIEEQRKKKKVYSIHEIFASSKRDKTTYTVPPPPKKKKKKKIKRKPKKKKKGKSVPGVSMGTRILYTYETNPHSFYAISY